MGANGAIPGRRDATAEIRQIEFIRNPSDRGGPFESYCMVTNGFVIALPIFPISNDVENPMRPSA